MEYILKTAKTPEQEQRQDLPGLAMQQKPNFETRSRVHFDDVRICYNSSEPARHTSALPEQPLWTQPTSPVVQLKPFTKTEIIALAQNENIIITEDAKILDILTLLDCDESTLRRTFKGGLLGAGAGSLLGAVTGGLLGVVTGDLPKARTFSKIGAGIGAAMLGISGSVHGINKKPETEMQNLLEFLNTLQLPPQNLNDILEGVNEEQYASILELLQKLSADWTVKKIDMSTSSSGDGDHNDQKRLKSLAEIFSHNDSGKAFLIEFLKNAVTLYDICGYDGILSLLVASTEYVSNNLLYDMDLNTQIPYEEATQRLQKMGQFVQSARQTLGEQAERYQLESTGSDPHKGGKHVLKMMRDGKLAGIYKPRSLKIDDAIVGQKGMFSYINHSITSEFQPQFLGLLLPTMQISSDNDDYGIEEAVEKKKSFSEKEAKNYYFQMGMLAAVAEYLGLSDLHQDNIMATGKGPMIIDAEVAFLNQHSGISAALTSNVGQKIGTSSIDGLSADFEIQKKDSAPVSAIFNYQQEHKDGPYHTAYKQGYDAMRQHMDTLIQLPEYSQELQQRISPGLSMRIVPLSTSDFAVTYQLWLRARENVSAKPSQEEILTKTISDVIEKLQKILTKGTPLRADDRNDISLLPETPEYSLQNLLRTSFENGDVPCFEVKITGPLKQAEPQNPAYSAIILLDGNVIGNVILHLECQPLRDA